LASRARSVAALRSETKMRLLVESVAMLDALCLRRVVLAD
jgi:hypothetical protein